MVPASVYEDLRSNGFEPGEIVPDSKVHRFGDKKSCWLVCHAWNTRSGSMEFVVVYGDWHDAETVYKHSTFSGTNREDKKHLAEQINSAKQKAEKAQQEVYSECRKHTSEYLPTLQPGTTPYLDSKGLKSSYGALVDGQNLIVPVGENPTVGYQIVASDGSKKFRYGTQKKGNYFRIPGSERTWLVEGFATGATVHEATGDTVIVCFDAGNVSAIRGKFPNATVAGDNDEAGRKCGPGCFPPDDGMDWNDYAQKYGLEAASKLLQQEPAEFVKPLGYFDDVYYYTSSSNRQIVPMTAGQHTDKHFLNLMPREYWESRYSYMKNPYNEAATKLMEECRAVGKFRPTHVRGTGVWWDNGPLINTGEGVYPKRRSDKYTYVLAEDVPTPGTESDPTLITEIIESLAWKNPDHGKMLLGWLAIAPFCGMLEWRPHIWLTGESGTGKSTIMQKIINPMLGKYKVYMKGNTTEAGIRQRLSNSALPIIFDEFEQMGEKSDERNKNIMDLFRNASFESDGEILKGSAGGKSIQYNPVFCALVSSIRVNLGGNEADNNRFTVLDLEKPDKAKYPELVRRMDLLTPEYCHGIFSYMWNRAGRIKTIAAKYYSMISSTQSQRASQQYSILMGAYELLTGKECSYEFKDSIEIPDQEACLHHLTEALIVVELGHTKHERNLQECLCRIFLDGETTDRPGYLASIERYGIKADTDRAKVFVARNHRELRKIFNGTRWHGAWSKSLERVKGAKSPTYPKFSGKTVNCIELQASEIVDI